MDDVIVGMDSWSSGSKKGPGCVRILSGKSGATLGEWLGRPGDDGFGIALADVGDIDCDGRDEVLVGTLKGVGGFENTAWICSGTTFEHVGSAADQLKRSGNAPTGGSFGKTLASLSDLDGDGVTDWAVTDNSEDGNAPFVTAFSGRTSEVLWQSRMSSLDGRLGASIVALPDVTGDGVGDLAVGCATDLGLIESCRVLLLSGSTGKCFRDIHKPSREARAALQR